MEEKEIQSEIMEALPAEETQQGRVRQLALCIILGLLLTGVQVFIVAKSPEWASKTFGPYCAAMAVLGVVFVSDETLMALVQRMPLPSFLGGVKK